jgi:hypothetical protein
MRRTALTVLRTAARDPVAGEGSTRANLLWVVMRLRVIIDFVEVLMATDTSANARMNPAKRPYTAGAPYATVVQGTSGAPNAGPAVARLGPLPARMIVFLVIKSAIKIVEVVWDPMGWGALNTRLLPRAARPAPMGLVAAPPCSGGSGGNASVAAST